MKKMISVNQYELPVTIKKDDDGFLAKCSVWKDCYAQGDTVDEALSEITAVATSLIELYNEEGLKVPLKVRKTTRSEILKLDIPLVVSA